MRPTRRASNRLSTWLETIAMLLSTLTKAIGIKDAVQARRLAGVIVNALLAVILAILLYKNKEILPLAAQVMTPLNIGWCMLLYLVSLLVQFGIWSNLMRYRLSELGGALDDYIRTILMGKLPGGLWKLFGRMTLYRPARLSPRLVLVINLVEILVALLANGLLLLLLSPSSWQLRAVLIAGVFLAFTLLPARLPQPLAHLRNPVPWLMWIMGYMLAWGCGGLITYLIISHFNASVTLPDAVRYWCSAGAAGLLLQVLPLSMLVRDVTLVAFLQPSMPLANAIIAAFTLRLVLMISELANGWMLLGVAWLTRRSFLNTPLEARE